MLFITKVHSDHDIVTVSGPVGETTPWFVFILHNPAKESPPN